MNCDLDVIRPGRWTSWTRESDRSRRSSLSFLSPSPHPFTTKYNRGIRRIISSSTPPLPPRPAPAPAPVSTTKPVVPPPIPARPSAAPAATTAKAAPPPPPKRDDADSRVSAYKTRVAHEIPPHLLRRFNKQVGSLLAYPDEQKPSIKGRLDMTMVELEEAKEREKNFRPEKLRAEVERAYATVWVPLSRVGLEVMRLGEWGVEWRRCAGWTLSYFILWASPLGILPSFILLLITLIVWIPSRAFLFPPPPLPSTPNSDTKNSPTKSLPEGVTPTELEAQAFAQEFADIAAATAAPPAPIETEVETPTSPETPTTKPTTDTKPSLLAEHSLAIQYYLSCTSTLSECLAAALSPSPPFSSLAIRKNLCLYLAPFVLLFVFVSPAVITKSCSAIVGVALFGRKGVLWASTKCIEMAKERMGEERWKEWLEDGQPQNSFLLGAPSNTQLVIRGLRDGERAGKPLPAVPPLSVELSAKPKQATPKSTLPPPSPSLPDVTVESSAISSTSDDPSISSSSSIVEVTADPETISLSSDGENVEEVAEVIVVPKPKVDHKARFATFVRTTARLGEQGAGYVSGQKKIDWEKVGKMAVDQIKTTTGSDLAIANQLMRSVPLPMPSLESGSTENQSKSVFYAHRGGAPGHLVISDPVEGVPATVSFVRIGKTAADIPVAATSTSTTESNKSVSLVVSDIVTIRKTAGLGLGWKGRLAAGWMLGGDGEGGGAGGLEIEWKVGEEKSKARFTAIVRRDELFNRLASIGTQEWRYV